MTVDNVEVRDLTVRGGKASADTGGGIVNAGETLLLQRLLITGNDAAGFSGGGLSNTGSATLDACTVTGNTAAFGAGLSNDLPTAVLTLQNTTRVESNTATQTAGGGVYNEGTLQLGKTFISNNTAPAGGGIQNQGGKVTLSDGTFVQSNTATGGTGTGFGGGINNQLSNSNQPGTINFADKETFVTHNTSNGGAGSGGGIFNKGTVTSTGPVNAHVDQNNPDQCVNNSGGTGRVF